MNSKDQGGMYTPIAGCAYPSDAWDAVSAPETACAAGGAQKRFRVRGGARETGLPV